MSEERSGIVPLLAIAVLFAVTIAALVLWRAPPVRPLQLGAPAPDLELESLDGGPIALADQRGRVVFVNFWATWCPPCRDEAPSLERLYAKLGDRGFEVLAVSIDAAGDRAAVDEFRIEFELSFPILLDPEQRAHTAFGVTGVPETYLIGPEGRLLERFIGPQDWEDPRYARAVQRLLPDSAGIEDG